jgi:hypothetical protein
MSANDRSSHRHRDRGASVLMVMALGVCVGYTLSAGLPTGAILDQTVAAPGGTRTMSASEYEDRIRASWYGQIAGTLMGFAFEHRAAAAAAVDAIPDRFKGIPIDDDWYYEMVAGRSNGSGSR